MHCKIEIHRGRAHVDARGAEGELFARLYRHQSAGIRNLNAKDVHVSAQGGGVRARHRGIPEKDIALFGCLVLVQLFLVLRFLLLFP